ncbi:hypothetical protein J2046_005561 [Rhizobium petrolearium]|uniref:Tetracyclin repressor-like C-terminal domain-containing protein n=2 Tax=Neorhizobium TaxID=1525371 RepID=A0ABV0MA40_9HYPH|nr:hypothetical protein [Neorhizobium petrolearium]MBP1847277.1 hypothetical protein [Neorhizobium petrolearium]MCC2614319.1 hypothetical protein [Neorhizobium petrolearium]WGI72564.1 hypothetical protein QEO92_31430 [Neorhizobium petrolearium]
MAILLLAEHDNATLSDQTAKALTAAFVTALITGLGIMRNVLQMDPLLDDEGGELESYLTTLLKTIMASA